MHEHAMKKKHELAAFDAREVKMHAQTQMVMVNAVRATVGQLARTPALLREHPQLAPHPPPPTPLPSRPARSYTCTRMQAHARTHSRMNKLMHAPKQAVQGWMVAKFRACLQQVPREHAQRKSSVILYCLFASLSHNDWMCQTPWKVKCLEGTSHLGVSL